MIIPYKDTNPTKIFPYVTITIIAINVAVFVMQVISIMNGGIGLRELAVVAANFNDYNTVTFNFPGIGTFEISPYVTLITSEFLHGGVLHLLSNMLFLWIFGNNVEDALGHFKFIFFYLICGVAASVLQISMNLFSTLPMLGASGAIAGVLGAYAIMYPHAKVHVFIFFFPFIRNVVEISALYFLGFWFIMQLYNAAFADINMGGVAWYAHIGGFVAGVLLIILINPQKRVYTY